MRNELGKYFINNGEIYLCIGYTEQPTIEFKNIRTGQKENCVVGSMVHNSFKKLYAIERKNGEYNFDDSAEEVENIVLEVTNDRKR